MAGVWDSIAAIFKRVSESLSKRHRQNILNDKVLDKALKKKEQSIHPAYTTSLIKSISICSQVIRNKPRMIRVRTNC